MYRSKQIKPTNQNPHPAQRTGFYKTLNVRMLNADFKWLCRLMEKGVFS